MRISDWSSDVCSSDLIIRHERTGSDEAHLALRNIQQAWKLVEAGRAQEMPERRDPLRVRKQLAMGIAIIGHRTELPQGETPALIATPFLCEEHTRPEIHARRSIDQREQRQHKWQQQKKKKKVEQAFQDRKSTRLNYSH